MAAFCTLSLQAFDSQTEFSACANLLFETQSSICQISLATARDGRRLPWQRAEWLGQSRGFLGFRTGQQGLQKTLELRLTFVPGAYFSSLQMALALDLIIFDKIYSTHIEYVARRPSLI